MINLPNKIPVFPLSNFIIFPETVVPLNIFEPRYLQMIEDAMKGSKIIGMIQPQKKEQNIPKLYNIGCAGKITDCHKTEDGRYLVVLSGISRFKIIQEINTEKLYRECKVNFNDFKIDLSEIKQKINFSDLELIFKKTKSLFNKHGYIINWKDLESQNLNQTINTISMASPFSLEEKQVLLEALNINDRKKKLEEILSTYSVDNISNTTLQ